MTFWCFDAKIYQHMSFKRPDMNANRLCFVLFVCFFCLFVFVFVFLIFFDFFFVFLFLFFVFRSFGYKFEKDIILERTSVTML